MLFLLTRDKASSLDLLFKHSIYFILKYGKRSSYNDSFTDHVQNTIKLYYCYCMDDAKTFPKLIAFKSCAVCKGLSCFRFQNSELV